MTADDAGTAQALANIPAPIRDTLAAFAAGVRAALGANLAAIYVFGSLLLGDFDGASSDLDFLAVVEEPLSEGELAALGALHRRLAGASGWGARLEGGYAVRRDLRPWGIAGSLAVVEPGEPLRPAAPSDYSADNMLALREHGVALYGPPPERLLPPVDRATLATGLRDYLVELLARPAAEATAQELASWIFNIARCLYGLETGRLSTKPQAARWLGERTPSLRPALELALLVRGGQAAADSDDRLRAGLAALRQFAAPYVQGPSRR